MLASHDAPHTAQPTAQRHDPTLGALLQKIAYAEVPSRFYTVLQACAPLAIQAWLLGWHRTAGWLLAAGLFGLWGLAQQEVEGYADLLDTPARARATTRLWRLVRGSAAVAGTLLTLLLVLEGFARILSGVFRCPGCAG